MNEPEYTEAEITRFWGYVDVQGTDDCWPWLRSKDGKGYGVFCARDSRKKAHRISYIQRVGVIPDGLVIDHLCRNRECVNPKHLRVVTSRTNTLENSESIAAVHAAKTHCIVGHAFIGRNIGRDRKGGRFCVECKNARQRIPNSTHKRRTPVVPVSA